MSGRRPLTGAFGRSERMLVVASLGYGAAGLGYQVLPPLLPTIIDQLEITEFYAGVAMSLLWAVRAASQYPSGQLSDRISPRTLLVGGLASVFVGSLLMGNTVGYPSFLVGAVVIGFGAGVYQPASIKYVTDLFADRRGRSIGLLIGAGDLAGGVAGLLVIGVLAVAPWRLTFAPVVLLLAVAAAALHVWGTDPYARPQSLGLNVRETFWRFARNRDLRLVVLIFTLWNFAFQSVIAFLPAFLQAEKGTSVAVASGGFALFWGIGILVKPVAGWLGDRLNHLAVSVATLTLSGVGVAGLVFAESVPVVLATILLVAVGLLSTTPLVYTYISNVSSEATGGNIGTVRAVLFGVGALGPLYVGYVASAVGYTPAFASLSAVLFLSALLVVAKLLWLDGE